MANFFGRSTDGSDSDNGSTWALAKASAAAELTAGAAGDTFFLSDNHADAISGAGTLTSPGTSALPCRVICVDDAGDPASPTTFASTAVIGYTGNITIAGVAYWQGISFQAGQSASTTINLFINATAGVCIFDNCDLKLASTGSASRIVLGSNTYGNSFADEEFINCTFRFSNSAHAINVRYVHNMLIRGGSLAGTTPTGGLFRHGAGASGNVTVRGMDLSSLGSNPIVDLAQDSIIDYRFQNCKLGTSFALSTGSFGGHHSGKIYMEDCDSGDTNYKFKYLSYEGTVESEITTVRSSGASDGTTPISIKMTSSANTSFHFPLRIAVPISLWNEQTGSSITVTAEGVTDNVTLKDDEWWLEFDYYGTSGFPICSFANDAKANTLATAANQTTSSVTWSSAPGTPVKQKASKAVTPQEKGPIYAVLCLAKPSTTVIFDYLLDIT